MLTRAQLVDRIGEYNMATVEQGVVFEYTHTANDRLYFSGGHRLGAKGLVVIHSSVYGHALLLLPSSIASVLTYDGYVDGYTIVPLDDVIFNRGL